MNQIKGIIRRRRVVVGVVGWVLIATGLLFSLLFTIIQLSSPVNGAAAVNPAGFAGVMAICPLPMIVFGCVSLAFYYFILRKRK